MTPIKTKDENVEMMYLGDAKTALFDEKGELYMLTKATRSDRHQLFNAMEVDHQV